MLSSGFELPLQFFLTIPIYPCKYASTPSNDFLKNGILGNTKYLS